MKFFYTAVVIYALSISLAAVGLEYAARTIFKKHKQMPKQYIRSCNKYVPYNAIRFSNTARLIEAKYNDLILYQIDK